MLIWQWLSWKKRKKKQNNETKNEFKVFFLMFFLNVFADLVSAISNFYCQVSTPKLNLENECSEAMFLGIYLW